MANGEKWQRQRNSLALSGETLQCGSLVQGDVVSLVALDFVLRVIRARVMDITFIVHVFFVHLHDPAADAASFRIPADMISNFERFFAHLLLTYVM